MDNDPSTNLNQALASTKSFREQENSLMTRCHALIHYSDFDLELVSLLNMMVVSFLCMQAFFLSLMLRFNIPSVRSIIYALASIVVCHHCCYITKRKKKKKN